MTRLLAIVISLAATSAWSQTDPQAQLVTREYRNVELRDLLNDLFSKTDVPYCLSEDIHGLISARFRGLPFESALGAVLKSCWLTYRREGVAYVFLPTQRYIDDQRWYDEHPELRVDSWSQPREIAPEFASKQEKTSDALWRLLWASERSFVIGPDLGRRITADFPSQPLGATLVSIAKLGDADMRCGSSALVFSGPYPWPLLPSPPPKQ